MRIGSRDAQHAGVIASQACELYVDLNQEDTARSLASKGRAEGPVPQLKKVDAGALFVDRVDKVSRGGTVRGSLGHNFSWQWPTGHAQTSFVENWTQSTWVVPVADRTIAIWSWGLEVNTTGGGEGA